MNRELGTVGIEQPMVGLQQVVSGSGKQVMKQPMVISGHGQQVIQQPMVISGNVQQIIQQPIVVSRIGQQVLQQSISGNGQHVLQQPMVVSGNGQQVIQQPMVVSGTGQQIIQQPMVVSGSGQQVIQQPMVVSGNGQPIVQRWHLLTSETGQTGVQQPRMVPGGLQIRVPPPAPTPDGQPVLIQHVLQDLRTVHESSQNSPADVNQACQEKTLNACDAKRELVHELPISYGNIPSDATISSLLTPANSQPSISSSDNVPFLSQEVTNDSVPGQVSLWDSYSSSFLGPAVTVTSSSTYAGVKHTLSCVENQADAESSHKVSKTLVSEQEHTQQPSIIHVIQSEQGIPRHNEDQSKQDAEVQLSESHFEYQKKRDQVEQLNEAAAKLLKKMMKMKEERESLQLEIDDRRKGLQSSKRRSDMLQERLTHCLEALEALKDIDSIAMKDSDGTTMSMDAETQP